MPSLNLDLDYPDHPKTKRLVCLLGRGAEALPILLWCYCGKYHRTDGSLTGYSPQEIESLVRWTGKPGVAFAALVRCGFLDVDADGNARIHDWTDHAGHLEHYHQAAKRGAKARWAKRSTKDPPCDPECGPHTNGNADRNAPASLGLASLGDTPPTPPPGGSREGDRPRGSRGRDRALVGANHPVLTPEEQAEVERLRRQFDAERAQRTGAA